MSEYRHESLAQGRWRQMSLSMQMANIGSEVSRAISAKNKEKLEKRDNAVDRALELVDLTIACAAEQERANGAGKAALLKELTRVRAVICDYCLFDNEYGSNDKSLQNYFDQFAMAARKDK